MLFNTPLLLMSARNHYRWNDVDGTRYDGAAECSMCHRR